MKCALCEKEIHNEGWTGTDPYFCATCARGECLKVLAQKEAGIKSGNDCMTCSNEATHSDDPPCVTCRYQIGDYNNWTKRK